MGLNKKIVKLVNELALEVYATNQSLLSMDIESNPDAENIANHPFKTISVIHTNAGEVKVNFLKKNAINS